MYRLVYSKKEQDLFRGDLPDIISIITNDFTEGVIYKNHLHTRPELLLILEGRGTQTIDNKEYPVKKGDMVILNGNSLHAESCSREAPIKVITCVLDNVKLRGLEDNCVIPKGVKPVVDCREYWEEISTTFRLLFHDRVRNGAYVYDLAKLNAARLIFYIYRLLDIAMPKEDTGMSDLTQAVKDYLDLNYEKDISLEDLAIKFYASSYHIAHEVKRELGMSPISYLINRRIGEAQRYLLLSQDSVEKISALVGYDNASYFNRLFLKKTGVTPTQFREAHSMDDTPPTHYVGLNNIRLLGDDESDIPEE